MVRWCLVLLLLPACLSIFPAAAVAADKKSKEKQQDYSIVAGTVFRDSGLALRGARVTLSASPEDKKPVKFKKMKAIADSRGEFAFRVPAGPMRYMVQAEADGFVTQEKPAAVQAAERVELYFSLEAVSR